MVLRKRLFFKNIPIVLFSFLVFLFAFFACSLIDEVDSQEKQTLGDGKILVVVGISTFDGDARYAVPSVLEGAENFLYAATLSTSTTTSDSDLVVGSYSNSSGSVTFSFPKSSATSNLILEIFAFEKPGSGTFSPSKSNALLSAKKEGLFIIEDTVDVGKLTLTLYKENKNKGSVNLSISLPDSSYSLSCSCSNASFTISGTSPNVTVTASVLEKGAYDIIFSVKKGEEIVYIWKEAINVYNGMETNSWKNLDGTISNKKQITEADIQTAALTTLYVRGEGDGWYKTNFDSAVANDENSGSVTRPLKTVQKAIDKVVAARDGTTAFTIYVDGEFTAESGKNVASISVQETPKLELSIIGLDSEKAVFKGNGTSVVSIQGHFDNHLTLTLQNLKITGGHNDTYGGGIYAGENDKAKCGGIITIKDCEISGNESRNGGGISYYGYGKSLVLDNCIVTKNTALYGGGLISYRGGITIKNGTVIGTKNLTSVVSSSNCGKSSDPASDGGNLSTGNGGGITLSANSDNKLVVGSDDAGEDVCYISGNACTGSGGGGGICIQSGGKLELHSGNFIQYNSGNGSGGAIFIENNSSEVVISGSIIGNKAAVNGGGIYNSGTLTMTGGIIDSNEAGENGGGIYNNVGVVNLSGESVIKSNDAYDGAGLYNYGGEVSISDKVHIEKNVASGENGGGIFNGCEVTISGGLSQIKNAGKLTLEGQAIYIGENTVENGFGGGIFNESGATAEIKSGVTISENSAAYNGGGIYTDGELTISGGTILNNSADKGAGIFDNGTLNLKNAAQISGEVFVKNGMIITITETLTKSPVATITPEKYPDGSTEVQVLTAASGVTLANEVGKFKVTDDSTGKVWKINARGKLEEDTNTISIPNVSEYFEGWDTNGSDKASDFLAKLNDGDDVYMTATVNEDSSVPFAESDIYILTDALYNISSQITSSGKNIKVYLTLNGNITEIVADNGYGTFWGCICLKEVNLENLSNLTKLGTSAFYSCSNLEKITFPNSLKEIANEAFDGCTNLSSVTFAKKNGWYSSDEDGSNSESINVNDPSVNAVKLREGDWKNKVLKLGTVKVSASEAVSALTSGENAGKQVDVEVSIGSTEDLTELLNALRTTNASGVTLVIDAENITELGTDGSFAGMNSLTQLEIKGSVTAIADSAFVGCRNLESVKISGNVTSIGNNAFQSCPDLTTVEIEDGLTSIGKDAFAGCTNLADINLPGSLETIGERAFTANAAEEITIPEGVTWIKQGAFSGCTKVKKITLPTTLEKMAPQAFSECTILEEMIFRSPSVWYVDGTGYEKTARVDVKDPGIAAGYFKPSSIYKDMYWYHEVPDELTVDEAKATLENAAAGSVVSIDVKVENASELDALIKVIKNETEAGAVDLILTEDSGITEIGKECFRYANKLRSVVLPVGLTTISDYSFADCSNLVSVSIPNTVTTITSGAFYNCGNLTKIVIPSSVNLIGKQVFEYCSKLENITIENPSNSTWYYTDTYNEAALKQNGTEISLSNDSDNATYFKTTYLSKYWYRD